MASQWPRGRSEYRTILILDIEGYGDSARSDAIRAWLRGQLHQVVRAALAGAGIGEVRYTAHSTGDGLLVTIDPSVGKPRILGAVLDNLATGLREQNRLAGPAENLRLRAVLHAADLLIDPDGPLGEQVNLAFELLDAEELRILLKAASGPLIVCVTDAVYRQVIVQRHEGLDPSAFEAVWLECKRTCELGWVRAPGEAGVVARGEAALAILQNERTG
jgi:hypothetical protein